MRSPNPDGFPDLVADVPAGTPTLQERFGWQFAAWGSLLLIGPPVLVFSQPAPVKGLSWWALVAVCGLTTIGYELWRRAKPTTLVRGPGGVAVYRRERLAVVVDPEGFTRNVYGVVAIFKLFLVVASPALVGLIGVLQAPQAREVSFLLLCAGLAATASLYRTLFQLQEFTVARPGNTFPDETCHFAKAEVEAFFRPVSREPAPPT